MGYELRNVFVKTISSELLKFFISHVSDKVLKRFIRFSIYSKTFLDGFFNSISYFFIKTNYKLLLRVHNILCIK